MKKSKMISEIADIIHTYRRNTETTTSDDIAYMVLEKIEDLGMLPPKIEGEYDSVPTVTPTGNHEYSWKRAWEYESPIEQAGAYLGSITNKRIIEALENDLSNPDLWNEDGTMKHKN